MKKTNILFFTFLAMAAGAPAVYAEVDPYIGVGYGLYQFEVDEFDEFDEFDDDQEALRIFGGVHFNDMIGAEITLYEFDAAADADIESDLQGASIAALVGAPIHDRFSLFAKVGWFWWEAELEATVPGDPVLTADFEGDDLFFGVGAKIGLTDAIDLRLDYDRFELEDDIDPDLDYASLSIQVNF